MEGGLEKLRDQVIVEFSFVGTKVVAKDPLDFARYHKLGFEVQIRQ